MIQSGWSRGSMCFVACLCECIEVNRKSGIIVQEKQMK